jgi:hypothetical protein
VVVGVLPGSATAATAPSTTATSTAAATRRRRLSGPTVIGGAVLLHLLWRLWRLLGGGRRPPPGGRLLGDGCPAPRRPVARRAFDRLLLDPLPRLRCPFFRCALGRAGGRLTGRVGRPLEDRGEAVRRRRLSRRCLGLSIHHDSLRSERGGDPDTARAAVAARSCAMNVPPPVQRLVPRTGLKTCSYNCRSCPGPRRLPGGPPSGCFGAAGGVARHLVSLPSPSRAARLRCRPCWGTSVLGG